MRGESERLGREKGREWGKGREGGRVGEGEEGGGEEGGKGRGRHSCQLPKIDFRYTINHNENTPTLHILPNHAHLKV